MAEYWKSTPKYWCKFCEVYVRDTGIERKNHEASAKHQNSIQRSLRGLHNDQAKQQREQQRAKSEVARLNGLVGSGSRSIAAPEPIDSPYKPRPSAAATDPVDYAAHRRAQAEQLVAMGMQVPAELRESVSGVGSWRTVSERVIEPEMTTIKPELSNNPEARVKGIHKRKTEEDDVDPEEQPDSKRRNWGSSMKTYPGAADDIDDNQDLDALLSGVSTKKATVSTVVVDATRAAASPAVKQEDATLTTGTDEEVKHEENESAITAPPIVAFKKRKAKR